MTPLPTPNLNYYVRNIRLPPHLFDTEWSTVRSCSVNRLFAKLQVVW